MAMSACFGGDPCAERYNPGAELCPIADVKPLPRKATNYPAQDGITNDEFSVARFCPDASMYDRKLMRLMTKNVCKTPFEYDNVLAIPRPMTSAVDSDEYGSLFSQSATRQNPRFQMLHGTTTLGFIFKGPKGDPSQGGVMVAVDSRASGGTAIFSYSVNKVIPISAYLLGTMAGGAADCTYWMRVLSRQVRMYELRNRERITVSAASKMLINMLYQYKQYGISIGSMVAGYDKVGPGLYLVTNEGLRAKGNIFSVGSGSPYALGVLDNMYKEEMTNEEAYELARRAIYEAGRKDIASGGFVSVYRIQADGWKKLSTEDISDLYFKQAKSGTI